MNKVSTMHGEKVLLYNVHIVSNTVHLKLFNEFILCDFSPPLEILYEINMY
jgi:hypothetical protein